MNHKRIPEEILLSLPAYFKPRKNVRPLTVVYQIHGDPELGGTWTVRIDERTCRVEPGQAESFDGKLIISIEDYLRVVAGELPPDYAWNTGRARYIGNFFVQGELNTHFRLPKGKGIRFI